MERGTATRLKAAPRSVGLLLGVIGITGCAGDEEKAGQPGRRTNSDASGPAAAPGPREPTRSVPGELRNAEVIFARRDGIYVGRADGTQIRRIFDLGRPFEYQPDVSPDGSRVAVRVDGGQRAGTWLFDIDGTNELHLDREANVVGGGPDWSPDGTRLVLNGKRPGETYFGLWIFDSDGSQARRITPDRWEAQYPAWSPDGELIAFTRVVPSRNEFSLYLVRPNGSGLRKLSRGTNIDNYAAWSPTGGELVFSSERPQNAGLWVIARDGSKERFLTEGGEPQWEPGEWIIFDCPSSDERGKTCVVRSDGSSLAELPLGDEAVFANWIPWYFGAGCRRPHRRGQHHERPRNGGSPRALPPPFRPP
jgi:Tol biopolymer transport system component